MSPPPTTSELHPRRPSRLRTGIEQPPAVVRPLPVTRTQPMPLTRRTSAPSPSALSPSAQRRRHSRFPLAARIAVGVVACILTLGGVCTTLLLFGQTDLIAWLVVGAVLTVVFGTPLLCLIGLIVFYIWALTRAGRSRRLPHHPRPMTASHQAQPVIVGEVVFDD